MRYVVFSDIHGNCFALDAMVNDLNKEKIEGYIFLGDVLGYFYWTHETINILRELPNLVAIRGNHDQYFLESMNNERELKRLAFKYGKSYLNNFLDDEVQFIKSFSLCKNIMIGDMSIGIFHGIPENLYEGRYYPDADYSLNGIEKYDVILLGNTHYRLRRKQEKKLILNPGSLGLPRDGKGYSYLVYDSDENSWNYHTVNIDGKDLYRRINCITDISSSNKQYLMKRVGEYI